MGNILRDYFGVSEASDLILRATTVDIKSLTIMCGKIHVPFRLKVFTHIQAVCQVDNTFTLWLGLPIEMYFREKEYGFNAKLSCNKVYCDEHGIQLIFEGQNEAESLRIEYSTLNFNVSIGNKVVRAPR